MRVLIVQNTHTWFADGQGFPELYNEEVWTFDTDELPDLDWDNYKNKNPEAKLYEYLELMGGTLVGFDELRL